MFPYSFTTQSGKCVADATFNCTNEFLVKEYNNIPDIALHHYVTKSLEDFKQKMALGAADGAHKHDEFFTAMNEVYRDICTRSMVNF